MSHAMVIFCTCPDEGTAARLASGLVEEKLAACVNILPGIRSIYRWQGAIGDDREALMVIKTMAPRYEQLEAWLLENHPYDVPEVMALPADRVARGYLDWIGTTVGN